MILAQAFSQFVLDLDGVMWRGDRAIPGSPETVNALRDAGKSLVFVTNNSWSTPKEVAERLGRLGATARPEDVVTSAAATALLIRREVPALRGRGALVLGGTGLTQAMEEIGLRLTDGKDPREVSLVVVGLDKRLTYERLRRATLAIRAGATFVAANTDPTLPAADGLWPGAGAIVSALVTATGATPMIAGKPHAPLMDVVREHLSGPALVVGDRVDTDVAAAKATGWPSALVLTGATGLADLAAADAWPDFLLRDLSHILRDLPHPVLRPAAGPDLPAIATLLHDGGLPAGAARERLGRTVVAEIDRQVQATAGWEAVGGAALLRSVATSPKFRGTGLGVQAVAGALRGIARAGLREVFLVTPDAEGFFAVCGFAGIRREELLPAIAAHPQLTRECPSTSPVMRMTLPLPERPQAQSG